MALNSLLPPRAGVARRLRPHPTRLAPLFSPQTVQKLPSRICHALLPEQWPHSRFTSRNEDAQSSSVASIDTLVIHDLRIMETCGFS
jgi:hypothetical protein